MIVKWGRYGRFLGCANYPECENIKPLNADDTPAPEPDRPIPHVISAVNQWLSG